MAKQRKTNKKKPSAHATRAAVPEVRLSQCMIVKNEEKNIEKALTWAKDIVSEQIVVDTGSTDRTIEIAESLGAKIYHFEWIDDFSAAKNYAIDQASGDWIIFTDADEYFQKDDAPIIVDTIKKIESAGNAKSIKVIECDWLQLEDSGSVFAVYQQQRIFRNQPDVRYINRIHEFLTVPESETVYFEKNLKLYHTGYTDSAYQETKKMERNERILREELLKRPDDLQLKGYLADSLYVDKTNAEKTAEALSLYNEIAYSGEAINEMTARNTFDQLIFKALAESDIDTTMDLARRAAVYLPDCPDYPFYIGSANYILKNYQEAWNEYIKCEQIIDRNEQLKNRMTPRNLKDMMHNMAHIAIVSGDYLNALHYSGLTLKIDKYTEDTLASLIMFMKITRDGNLSSAEEAIEYLRMFYDFTDPYDKLFIAKCAKKAGDELLMHVFHQLLTDEDKTELSRQE